MSLGTAKEGVRNDVTLKCPSWQRKRGVMYDSVRSCGTLVSLWTAKAGVRDDVTCPLSVPLGSERGVRARAYAREYEKPGRGAWPHDNNTVHVYIRVCMRVNMRSRAGGRGRGSESGGHV